MVCQRRRFLVAIAAAASGSAGCSSGQKNRETASGPPTPQRDSLHVNVTYDDPDIEYFEANDTVRYTAGRQRAGTERTVVDFERWASPRAAQAGAERVEDSLREGLSGGLGPGVSVGYERGDGSQESWEILVFLTTTEDRDGSVVTTPSVGPERIAAATPRRVHVRLTVDGREFRAAYPVRLDAVTQVRG